MSEERKLVTILFADVTASTALGEALDPEDVRALMSRYYGHAQRIISQYSGTLEKFIGDAVMAIFGLPQVHGDDAERALAAALALREAVRTDPVLAERFVLRMGVNTGEVVGTSDPSSGDFLVTGDVVNVAACLQQAASPGEIFTGERSALAAQAARSAAPGGVV
jgi:class 3 adenylate cyclase